MLSRDVVGVRGDPYYQVAALDWDDMEALRHAFESPVGRETAADVESLSRLAEVRSMICALEDQF
jgi:hypothetical protein